jgi:hypothetical protein
MAARPIAFDVQHLIDEVAARHRLLLKPDDAAFAIVTMNRLVLEESLEAIHSRIVQDLALFEASGKKMQSRAGTNLAAEVREAAAGIRQELERDMQDARLQASKIIRQVETTYQQRLSGQKLTIAVLAAVLLFCCGVWAGRISLLWWPL